MAETIRNRGQRRSGGLYRGYSSFEFQDNKSFKIYDLELVKLDLLNHIFTRRGERVMMPNFGTSIPDIVFEPLTEELINFVADEVTNVIGFDPRVELLDLQVEPDYDGSALTVSAQCFYIELGLTDNFELNIQFEA